jgi:hypothetical protein
MDMPDAESAPGEHFRTAAREGITILTAADSFVIGDRTRPVARGAQVTGYFALL